MAENSPFISDIGIIVEDLRKPQGQKAELQLPVAEMSIADRLTVLDKDPSKALGTLRKILAELNSGKNNFSRVDIAQALLVSSDLEASLTTDPAENRSRLKDAKSKVKPLDRIREIAASFGLGETPESIQALRRTESDIYWNKRLSPEAKQLRQKFDDEIDRQIIEVASQHPEFASVFLKEQLLRNACDSLELVVDRGLGTTVTGVVDGLNMLGKDSGGRILENLITSSSRSSVSQAILIANRYLTALTALQSSQRNLDMPSKGFELAETALEMGSNSLANIFDTFGAIDTIGVGAETVSQAKEALKKLKPQLELCTRVRETLVKKVRKGLNLPLARKKERADD